MRTETRELLAVGILGRSSVRERIETLLTRGREFSARASGARVAISVATMLGFVIASSLTPRWIAFAQEEPAVRFEAASIKPSDPDHVGAQMYSPSPGRFRTLTTTLKDLIGFAYQVEPHQIAGVPLDSGKYDINAKAEGPATGGQFRRMLQTLLADRFQVRFHRETSQLPVYDLVAAKNGPKLREVGSPGFGVDFGTLGFVRGRGADLRTLASVLSRQLGRSVLDKTGIKGYYDFTLKWTPDVNLTADAADPDVFTAIQEQLGLKLEASKSPVEILVIDHAEKPDAN